MKLATHLGTVQHFIAAGGLGVTKAARTIDCSKATYYRHVAAGYSYVCAGGVSPAEERHRAHYDAKHVVRAWNVLRSRWGQSAVC